MKGDKEAHEPFTFRPLGPTKRERLRAAPPFRCVLSEGHEERPGAPGTLLAENFLDTNLRAWDFTSGEAFRSTHPIIFSYSDDPRSKRAAWPWTIERGACCCSALSALWSLGALGFHEHLDQQDGKAVEGRRNMLLKYLSISGESEAAVRSSRRGRHPGHGWLGLTFASQVLPFAKGASLLSLVFCFFPRGQRHRASGGAGGSGEGA